VNPEDDKENSLKIFKMIRNKKNKNSHWNQLHS